MTWEDIIASGYKDVVANPASGDVQIWEITNKSGGWFHPVHIHLVDFKMLTRNGKPVFNYEQGPKDVAYVGENETIRAIMRFGTAGDSTTDGRYMIHCHNLPHEDHDMMTQFRVGADVDRDPRLRPGRPRRTRSATTPSTPTRRVHRRPDMIAPERPSPSHGTAAPAMWHRGGVPEPVRDSRDRDPAGRARNARPRDAAGRPLPRGAVGVERVPDDLVLGPEETVARPSGCSTPGCRSMPTRCWRPRGRRPSRARGSCGAGWRSSPSG